MTQVQLSKNKIVAGLALLILLIVGLTVSLVLSRQSQDNRSAASGNNNCCFEWGNCGSDDAKWQAGYYACVRGECGLCGGGAQGCDNDGKCEAGEDHNNCSKDCSPTGDDGGTGGSGGGSGGGGGSDGGSTVTPGMNEDANGNCQTGYFRQCGSCLANVCVSTAQKTCNDLIYEYCGELPCYMTNSCDTCNATSQPRCVGTTLQHCVNVDGVYVWQTRETDSASCDGSGDGTGSGGPVGGGVDNDPDDDPVEYGDGLPDSKCTSWNVYECIGGLASGQTCQQTFKGTFEDFTVAFSTTPTCRTRQAFCTDASLESRQPYYDRYQFNESICDNSTVFIDEGEIDNSVCQDKWAVYECDRNDTSCSSPSETRITDGTIPWVQMEALLLQTPTCKRREAFCIDLTLDHSPAPRVAINDPNDGTCNTNNSEPGDSDLDNDGDSDLTDGSQDGVPGGNAGSGGDGSNRTPVPMPTMISTIDTCPADINLDGIINLSDYSLLASDFLNKNPGANRTDINRDGIVNLSDFSILASRFLKTCEKTVTL